MKLSTDQVRTLETLLQVPSDEFTTLIKVAKLDPGVDFRGADLSGMDFGVVDLAGYDFTNADLSGADLRRAKIRGAKLGGAVLANAILPANSLRPSQQEAFMAVVEHLRRGHRRALLSMPPGMGVSRIIAELASYLSAGDPGHGGLILCSSQAVCERLPDLLVDAGLHNVERLTRSAEMSADARWRVATYREYHKRLLSVSGRDRESALPAGPILLMEADHVSFSQLKPILGATVNHVQIASIGGATPKSDKVERYFRGHLTHVITTSEAVAEGGLRPFQPVDRRQVVQFRPEGQEVPLDQVEYAARDFVRFLANEGLMLRKSVILCGAQDQARAAAAVVNDMYGDVAPPKATSSAGVLEAAAVPRSIKEMRAWMEESGPPYVICCRPPMVGDTFDPAPDCVGVLLRGIGGRTRTLWASASATGSSDRPILVVDYTGALKPRQGYRNAVPAVVANATSTS